MLTAALLATVAALSPQNAATPAATVPAAEPRTMHLTAAEMFRLAEVASANEDPKTVEAIYAALEENPNSEIRAEARIRHAKGFIAQNRNRDAAVLLRRILDEKPGATGIRLELAHVFQVLGDDESALRELRAAQAGICPSRCRG